MLTSWLPSAGATIAAVTPADLTYVIAGVAILLAAALPRLVRRRAVSAPMGFVAAGLLVGLLPLPTREIDPIHQRIVTERLTEIAVIVALMAVGLALDRPFGWRRWSTTWRLLVITMPACIAAVALLGWWVMGLAPATALLLGAVLAPTDPVLASEVQVGEPNAEGEEDEVRFALTSEAGLNDGLAFPFVYAAIAVAGGLGVHEWLPGWLAWTLVGKVTVGVAVGVAVGWLLVRLAFTARTPGFRYAEVNESIVALAATFVAYGVAEAAQGYGFLAVFSCAVAIRQYDRHHAYHQVLHSFITDMERLLTLILLLLLGVACATGLLAALTWRGALVGVALVLVLRPVVGWCSLLRSRPFPAERGAIAFFGVRGIGSIYYLSYAAGQEAFGPLDELWSTVAFTILLSVLVHGVVATPWMSRLDRAREAGRLDG